MVTGEEDLAYRLILPFARNQRGVERLVALRNRHRRRLGSEDGRDKEGCDEERAAHLILRR
jgi:hypothetical protein